MNRKDASAQAQTARATATAYAATVSLRSYFSTHHLAAAALFARESARIEREYIAQYSGEPPTSPAVFAMFSAHRSNVIGCILSAVGFLEAAINELYVDAAERHPGYIESLSESTIQTLSVAWTGTWWQKGIDWEPVLKKYQIALAVLCGFGAMVVGWVAEVRP